MRPLLHFLSILLVLPGVLLAGLLLILGRAIAAHSWSGFFGHLWQAVAWLLPWGILACFGALLLLALGGLSNRYRWIAGLCVAVLAIGSTSVILILSSAPTNFSSGQWMFLVPALASASIGIWLAATERPRGKSATPAS